MLKDILEENVHRNRALRQPYNPIKGIGCLWPRKLVDAGRWDEGAVWLPASMLADPEYNIGLSKLQYRELRYRHDFEYWCATCIKIHNKSTRRTEPFILNRAQRRLFAVMERQRLAGKPVRVILLKARQWGGSTLTQIYMAWWQLILYENCNSVICSHLKDTSAAIRAMYSKLLERLQHTPYEAEAFRGVSQRLHPSSAGEQTCCGFY